MIKTCRILQCSLLQLLPLFIHFEIPENTIPENLQIAQRVIRQKSCHFDCHHFRHCLGGQRFGLYVS